MKTIWLVSEGLIHPPLDGQLALRQALKRSSVFQVLQCRRLEQLPVDMSGVVAVALYLHRQQVDDAALHRLLDYAASGGGVLGVHSATASFKTSLAYFELLGGRFIGHGKVQPLQFRPLREDLFGGMTAFSVRDELYHHDFQPNVEVHWLASAGGEEAPAVWTHRYAAGRVCYLLPGHLGSSLRHPAVREIIRRGLNWVLSPAEENSS